MTGLLSPFAESSHRSRSTQLAIGSTEALMLRVDGEDPHGGGLTFQFAAPPVLQSSRSARQSLDGLLSEIGPNLSHAHGQMRSMA